MTYLGFTVKEARDRIPTLTEQIYKIRNVEHVFAQDGGLPSGTGNDQKVKGIEDYPCPLAVVPVSVLKQMRVNELLKEIGAGLRPISIKVIAGINPIFDQALCHVLSLGLDSPEILALCVFRQIKLLSVMEVHNPEEVHSMLDFVPGRIGHACFFQEYHSKKLKSYGIPVEICLTSNIRTESILSLDIHHFADLYGSKHPIILYTDDIGVFSTSLSREYNLASTAFERFLC